MAQHLIVLAAFPEDPSLDPSTHVRHPTTTCTSNPEFNSQQPHGGSQPPMMGPDAFFWCADVREYRALKYRNK